MALRFGWARICLRRDDPTHITGWRLLAHALALAIQIVFKQFILIILLTLALLRIGVALQLLQKEDKIRPMLARVWNGAR